MIDERKYELLQKVREKYEHPYSFLVDISLTEEEKHNKELAKCLMKEITPRALELFAPEIINDRELLIKALSHWGFSFEYANEESRNDPALVLLAIRHASLAWPFQKNPLKYASNELKNNKKLIRDAFLLNAPFMIDEYANRTIKGFEKICSQVTRLKNNKEAALEAIIYNPYTIFYISKSLKKNVKVLARAVAVDSTLLSKWEKENYDEYRSIVSSRVDKIYKLVQEQDPLIEEHYRLSDEDILKELGYDLKSGLDSVNIGYEVETDIDTNYEVETDIDVDIYVEHATTKESKDTDYDANEEDIEGENIINNDNTPKKRR